MSGTETEGFFSDAEGRIFFKANLLEVGGYQSGHFVTTYLSPNPNVGDVLTYAGSGNAQFLPPGAAGGPLTVPEGGTGDITFTNNAVVVGSGVAPLRTTALNASGVREFLTQVSSGFPVFSALTAADLAVAVPPSTSGNVLTSNGTTWTSAAAAGGAFAGYPVVVTQGGTGNTGPATLGSLLVGAGAGLAMTFLPVATDTWVLTLSGGVPVWAPAGGGGAGGFTGYPVTVAQGGTGQVANLAVGTLLLGGGPGSPMTPLAIGASTFVLSSNGTTAVWASGAGGGFAGYPVTVGQGGTGVTTLQNNGVLYGQTLLPLGVTASGATGQVLTGADPSPPSFQYLFPRVLYKRTFTVTNPTPNTVLDTFAMNSPTVLTRTSMFRVYVVFGNPNGAVNVDVAPSTNGFGSNFFQSSTDTEGAFTLDFMPAPANTGPITEIYNFANDRNTGVDNARLSLGTIWESPWNLELRQGNVLPAAGIEYLTWTVVQMSG